MIAGTDTLIEPSGYCVLSNTSTEKNKQEIIQTESEDIINVQRVILYFHFHYKLFIPQEEGRKKKRFMVIYGAHNKAENPQPLAELRVMLWCTRKDSNLGPTD